MKKQFLLTAALYIALLWLIIIIMYLCFDFIAEKPYNSIVYAIFGTILSPVLLWTQFKNIDKNSDKYLKTIDAELPIFKASAVLKTSKSFDEIKESLLNKGYDIIIADAEKEIICFNNKQIVFSKQMIFLANTHKFIGAKLKYTKEDNVCISYFPLTAQFPSNKVAQKVSAKFLSELEESLN